MRKLIACCKGAVTVMVTLLLIPAILVSGTGVDLARLYAAKSTLQDANLLAANSALAQYDALLQDLYGLFGIMQSDHEFATMVDSYLQTAVLGEDWFNRDLGTFQLFYGSDLETTGIVPKAGQNLGNADVLRRQIEEYAKLRAPVIVVEEVLDKLDTFEKVQEDAKIIKEKLEVDDKVEDVDKAYRKVYKCIQDIKPCEQYQRNVIDNINTILSAIHGEFQRMNQLRSLYKQRLEEAAQAELDEDYAYAQICRDQAAQYKKEYDGRVGAAHPYVNGGSIHAYNTEGEVTSSHAVRGIDSYVREYSENLENYVDGLGNDLATLIDLCEDADKKKAALKEKIVKLENDLNAGKCTDELREGMIVEQDESGRTMIDRYKELLLYDLTPMAQAMYDWDSEQIRETISIMDNAGVIRATTPYTWRTIQGLGLGSIPIDGSNDTVTAIANGTLAVYMPARSEGSPGNYVSGFKQFSHKKFDSTKNREFYDNILEPMCGDKGKDQAKSRAKSNVTKIFEKAQELFKSKLEFTPEGAEYLTGGEDASTEESGTDFGTEGDWGKEDEGKNKLKDSLDGDFLSKLTNAAGELGNHALLMVYDTEMFSDYSTPRLKNGEAPRKSMAGIPMGPDVNYYYHSELEYLYNGNLADAHVNLRSVAGMILLVRFIFNYVASFTVKSVRETVGTIRSALAGTGPFAILVSELTRMGFAIGESAMDVERLRQGERVALFKNNDTWKFSIRGLADSITGDIGEIVLDEVSGYGSDEPEGDDGALTLTYTDYLRLFLLLVDGDTLAVRTANLIELNVTNYKYKINANEEKMSEAERFDLTKAITGFSLTTTAEMKMLFLSMPMAQEGVNGIIPPKTLSVSATDYRGY